MTYFLKKTSNLYLTVNRVSMSITTRGRFQQGYRFKCKCCEMKYSVLYT